MNIFSEAPIYDKRKEEMAIKSNFFQDNKFVLKLFIYPVSLYSPQYRCRISSGNFYNVYLLTFLLHILPLV